MRSKRIKRHFLVVCCGLCVTLGGLVASAEDVDLTVDSSLNEGSTLVQSTANTTSDSESEVAMEAVSDEVASGIDLDSEGVSSDAIDLSQALTVSVAFVQDEQVMSDQEKQRAIDQMGANQGDVWVWSSENEVEGEARGPNGGPGQFNGGAVVMGGKPSYDPPADWYYLAYKGDGMTDEEALANFNSERGKWMDEFDPWGVIVEMSDNTASTAWADVRNMQAFVLREDSTVWEKIVDDPSAVQWVAQFKGNMSSYVEEANQTAIESGGTSIEVLVKQDRVAHWGSEQARYIENPESIRAVLVVVEARMSENSDPDAKLGIQVGGDWKYTETEVIHPFWYPGAGLSGIQRLTSDWARYYFVSIRGVQDAIDERAISTELFFASVVPLADLTTIAEQSTGEVLLPDEEANFEEKAVVALKDGEPQSHSVQLVTEGENPPISEMLLKTRGTKKLPNMASRSEIALSLVGVVLMLSAVAMIPRKDVFGK